MRNAKTIAIVQLIFLAGFALGVLDGYLRWKR
jgi:hypothetical protein